MKLGERKFLFSNCDGWSSKYTIFDKLTLPNYILIQKLWEETNTFEENILLV